MNKSRHPLASGPLGRTKRCAGLAVLCLALAGPSVASAAFTRPFVRQIAGQGGGIAVDAEDHLWVSPTAGGAPSYPLVEFESPEHGSAPVKTLEIAGPERNVLKVEFFMTPASIAINASTGSFYITGANSTGVNEVNFVEAFSSTGAFELGWGPVEFAQDVAVDNSSDVETKGDVYVEANGSIYRFNAIGEPAGFSGVAEYVSGNRLTGLPGEPGEFTGAVTVDSSGDIYAVSTQAEKAGVYEFGPSGVFLRSFTGAETPGIGERHSFGGLGGDPEGVAVDPTNGHVLVSVWEGRNEIFEGAIDEFDASGHYLSQIVEREAGSRLGRPSAITVDSHGYLSVSSVNNEGVVLYAPGRFLPSLKLAESSQRKPTSAILNGDVNPQGISLTKCKFEYVSEAAFQETGFADLGSGGEASCFPGAASIPLDSNFHPVHAEVAGLLSGETYRYRVTATSSGAEGGTGHSSALAFTASHAPRIDSTTAGNVSSTFAQLEAEIDPLGAASSYRFEYLTEAQFLADGETFGGAISVPAAAVQIGSGEPTGSVDVSVRQEIGGLVPGTSYRFRVSAENEVGATPGAVAGFATLPEVAIGLSDNRSYELVTPPAKGGAADMFSYPLQDGDEYVDYDAGLLSESGERFLFYTLSVFGPSPATEYNGYVFSRTATGWTFKSLASASLGVQSITTIIADPIDLSRFALDDLVGSQPSPTGSQSLSLTGALEGPYVKLHADAPVQGKLGTEDTAPVGASRDLSHIVLESLGHGLIDKGLAEKQVEGSHALYEWAQPGAGGCTASSPSFNEGSQGCMQLVNVKSSGELLSRCGAQLGYSPGSLPGGAHHAVSADGSRIVFVSPDPTAENKGAGCWNGAAVNTPQLYMRSGGTTVEISAPQPGVSDPTGPHPAVYVGASEDGSRVFFLTKAELTSNDAGIHVPELYEWEIVSSGACNESNSNYNPVSAGCLTRVSAGESGSPGATSGADVPFVPAVSADGSAVYFTAFGKLTSAAQALPAGGAEVNLYRYDAVRDSTVYVAAVETANYPETDATGYAAAAVGTTEVALDPGADWYTTPDGRYLLFGTTRSLTAYSTVAPSDTTCEIPGSQGAFNGHCQELYRYDSLTGDITCVSCDPSGAPPTSNARFSRSAIRSMPDVGPVRAMTDDGSRIFFDTADALVPQDTNGTLDVYEWEAQGTGECALAGGCMRLISSGSDSAQSFFLGQSAAEIDGEQVEGANVFFGTHARLVPADTDDAGDVYDARVDGGFPPPPSREGLCEGDACVSPSPLPIDSTPASLTLAGNGDVVSQLPPSSPKIAKKTATTCKKGFVRKKVKKKEQCVKGKKRAKRSSVDRRPQR